MSGLGARTDALPVKGQRDCERGGQARPAASLHLTAELEWLRVLLNVHTRRMQREGLLPGADAGGPDPVVSFDEVSVRLARPRVDLFRPRGELTDEELQALGLAEAHRRSVEADLLAGGAELPLLMLRARCELTEADYLLLLLGLATELGGDFPRIFAFLNNDTSRPWPTLAMVMDCLSRPDEWMALRARLEPRTPLMRYRLLEAPVEGWEPSRPQQPLVPSGRVRRYVSNEVELDPDMRAFATFVPGGAGAASLLLPEADREPYRQLEALLEVQSEQGDRRPLIVLRGPEGAGRHTWANAAATRRGLGTLAVDAAMLAARRGSFEQGLAEALREARLQGALLCLSGWEELVTPRLPMLDEEGGLAPGADLVGSASVTLENALLEHPDPLVLFVGAGGGPLPTLARGLHCVDLTMPDRPMAAELWRRHLVSQLPDEQGEPFDAEQLAVTYRLPPGQLAVVARESLRRAALQPDGRLTASMLNEAVKENVRHRLGEQARWVKPRYRFEDLIVAPEVTIQLREMVSRHRHSHTVLKEWGYAKRFGDDLGLSSLFEGPPGTGKTMAASIVASELGLDLYQVDLSRVVSKYIGETEKNLGRIFDEAERARVMLLFDEADSLFAKRTQVKSSNDRYANLEVNYLLQRIEVFSGICVLTTNAADNMDEAFARRLTQRVRFDSPDREQRARLWRSMLAGRERVGDDIDVDHLAEEFDISGGLIRNSVLRAAFMAAARGRPIDHELLYVAVRIEMRQQGKLVSGSPLIDLVELFGEAPATPGPSQ